MLYKRRGCQAQLIDFLFPDEIYATNQFLKDAAYFVLITLVAAVFGYGLAMIAPPMKLASSSLTSIVIGLIVFDGIMFATHYAQHRIPFLWRFHKLHHEPDRLHFLIGFKHHPVDIFLMMTILTIVACVVPNLLTNPLLILFYAAGYHLRHSHIPLEYPKWLNAVLVSPSDHQRHHSKSAAHYNQNLGFIFSFWERLLPKPKPAHANTANSSTAHPFAKVPHNDFDIII